eukprot:4941792-Pleurochrysis_carterae.AAC.3
MLVRAQDVLLKIARPVSDAVSGWQLCAYLSIQNDCIRHTKLISASPSVTLTAATRTRLTIHESAIRDSKYNTSPHPGIGMAHARLQY